MQGGDVAPVTGVVEYDDGTRYAGWASVESSNLGVVKVLPSQPPYERLYGKAIAPGSATIKTPSRSQPLTTFTSCREAGDVYERARLAMRAPSAIASSFAHMIDGCHRRLISSCAKPQSVPAIRFSRPTHEANRVRRSAMSSGCSTTFVPWLTTPGTRIFPGGSFTSCHTFHSCS